MVRALDKVLDKDESMLMLLRAL